MKTALVSAAFLLALASTATAQRPFFNSRAVAYEPTIDIVNSGALLDAQATVSADRKCVTLNMRPSNAELLNLHTFAFQQGGQAAGNGFAGGVNPVPLNGPATMPQAVNPPRKLEAGHGGVILLTRGMTPLVVDR